MILTAVPDGDLGTAETIDQYMRPLIAEGVRSFRVRELALYYLDLFNVPRADKIGEMRAIFEGVRLDFQFRDDPAMTTRSWNGQVVTEGTEMLQPAEGMIASRAGDCDCHCILICSLLGSIGFATQLVTIKADASRPSEFSHIYPEAQDPDAGAWIALDIARSDPQFGREPEFYWERKQWPMTSAARYLNGYGLGSFGPWRGMGRMVTLRLPKSRFPRRGLGQDDGGSTFDASQLAMGLEQQTPAILQGIAQVTKAANTPGVAYSGVGLSPTATTGTGISIGGSGWLVLAILAVVGIAAWKKG